MSRKSPTSLQPRVLEILRKPGEGLLTVTTGSGKAEKTLGPLVGDLTGKEWVKQAKRRLKAPAPHIVALPNDTGGGICRGAAHGPLALRAALYAKHPQWAACDLGDIPCVPQLLEDSMLTPKQKVLSGKALWGAAYNVKAPVAPLNLLQEFLIQSWEDHGSAFKPFVMGGDHSISGSVFEALYATGKTKQLAVLHFDAHTDLMESRYGVERCFATWAAHAVKRLKPSLRSSFTQVGLRVSGKTQKHWETKYGLKQYWAPVLSKIEAKVFAKNLLEHWKKQNCDSLYISFDVDALDPVYVPSTGTPEPHGLRVKWCRDVIDFVSREFPVIAADVVELAPVLGSKAEGNKSANNAALVAQSLLKALARSPKKENT